MTSFADLYARAVVRKGEVELEERIPVSPSREALADTPDDRFLSMMTRRVFQAGFVYRVIEAKWPGFEEAFEGFDPPRVATMSGAEVSALKQDTRIVRNGQKIEATIENARFVCDIAEEHGSLGRFVADWPDTDLVGLWALLKKRGARLGGDTGPRFLRAMGKPTFVLTQDVVRALVEHGVVEKKPTSKKALQAAQEAFDNWSAESGRDHSAISIVLACTIDSGEH